MKSISSGALRCAFLFAWALPIFAQGPLAPSAAPAPTMKTLDQVEARKPIDPAQPGFALPYDINARGSYYLAGNITASAATAGIHIYSDGVTLDLNGFTLNGNGLGTAAIQVIGAHKNVAVSNGTLLSWGAGIDGSTFENSQVSKLRVSDCPTGINLGIRCEVNDCSVADGSGASGNTGIHASDRSIVRNSTVSFFSSGIEVGSASVVENCVAAGNNTYGFRAFGGVTLENCVAETNTGIGFFLFNEGNVMTKCVSRGNGSTGISAFEESNLEGCTVRGNLGLGISASTGSRITGNDVIANNGGGIYTQNRCTIRDNSVIGNNGGDGVRVTADCVLTNNFSGYNGLISGGGWDGFFVVSGGSRNVFDSNQARGNNSFGINLGSGTGNTVIRNEVNGNPSGAINPS